MKKKMFNYFIGIVFVSFFCINASISFIDNSNFKFDLNSVIKEARASEEGGEDPSCYSTTYHSDDEWIIVRRNDCYIGSEKCGREEICIIDPGEWIQPCIDVECY